MPEYNAYQWNPNLGGSTEEQYVRNSYNNMGRFANQLGNFGSQFYGNYMSAAQKGTPGVGTNAFLSPLMSGGGNYAQGMSQALTLKGNAMKNRQDVLNTGFQNFASNNMGMLANLLGQQGQTANSIYSTKTQKEANENQGSPWQMAGSILGTLGGIALAPMTGGLSLGLTAGGLSGMFGGGQQQQSTYQGQGQNYNPFSNNYFPKR